MAGMFYSVEEAVEKLNMTEEQLKELVRGGKLREFRDGSNVLFKVDEVEALMPDTAVTASQGIPAALEEETDNDVVPLVPETTVPETAEPETAVPESAEPETAVPETAEPETAVPEPAEPETAVPETTEPEIAVPETAVPETAVPETAEPETTEDTAPGDELTNGDTVVAEQGINVLGETDGDYQAIDDTKAETKGTTA